MRKRFKTRGQQVKDDRLARRIAEEYGKEDAKKLMTSWGETGGRKEKKGKSPTMDQHEQILKYNEDKIKHREKHHSGKEKTKKKDS